MSRRHPEAQFVEGPIPRELVTELIAEQASHRSVGAHSMFLGQVRSDEVGDARVAEIEYSAYREMGAKELSRIVGETKEQYGATGVTILHSLGRVTVGELCLCVLVVTGHRDAAFTACRAAVEAVKQRVPIFGREILDDGSFRWKTNTPSEIA